MNPVLRVLNGHEGPSTDPEWYARIPASALLSSTLTDTAIRILGILALECARNRRSWTHCTNEEIGRLSTKSRSVVIRSLRLLEKEGYLEVTSDKTVAKGPRRLTLVFNLKPPSRGVIFDTPGVSETTPLGIKNDTLGCQKRHPRVPETTPPLKERGRERKESSEIAGRPARAGQEAQPADPGEIAKLAGGEGAAARLARAWMVRNGAPTPALTQTPTPAPKRPTREEVAAASERTRQWLVEQKKKAPRSSGMTPSGPFSEPTVGDCTLTHEQPSRRDGEHK